MWRRQNQISPIERWIIRASIIGPRRPPYPLRVAVDLLYRSLRAATGWTSSSDRSQLDSRSMRRRRRTDFEDVVPVAGISVLALAERRTLEGRCHLRIWK